MFSWPVHFMRQRRAVALVLNSTRSQPEFTVWYSGEKVAAVLPACSDERQRVRVCVGVRLPFMTMVSVSCHSPGAMPSAAAGGADRLQASNPMSAPEQVPADQVRRTGRIRRHMEYSFCRW